MDGEHPAPACPARLFENHPPGRTEEFGKAHADGDEIASFARRHGPQVFHADAEAANWAGGWRAARVPQPG